MAPLRAVALLGVFLVPAAMFVANRRTDSSQPTDETDPKKLASPYPPDAPVPSIVDIDPDPIAVTGGDIRLNVAYAIAHVERAEHASLVLYTEPPQINETFPLDLVEEGAIELVFRNLGPTRFDRWFTERPSTRASKPGDSRALKVRIWTEAARRRDQPYARNNAVRYLDEQQIEIVERRVIWSNMR